MKRFALAALCAAMSCSSVEAQSLLGVAPSTQSTSTSRVTPPPPLPGDRDSITQYASSFHDSGLFRLQEELLAAFITHENGPRSFPHDEANLRALTTARQLWHARRTERSLIYRDLSAAVDAFATHYRSAWRLRPGSAEQQSAKFRYDEAYKDMWKLARDPMAPFHRADAQFQAAFWAQELRFASSNVEREIARVLAEVYKAQLATPRSQRASR